MAEQNVPLAFADHVSPVLQSTIKEADSMKELDYINLQCQLSGMLNMTIVLCLFCLSTHRSIGALCSYGNDRCRPFCVTWYAMYATVCVVDSTREIPQNIVCFCNSYVCKDSR